MTTPKSKAEVLAQMNADAELARKEFEDVDSVAKVALWWERWFQKAGHKRLAYILMGRPMPEKR